MFADYDIYLVFGTGKTGRSCLHYLLNLGAKVFITDTRDDIDTKELENFIPYAELDKIDPTHIVVSPGVPLTEPYISKQMNAGKNIIGDIELFSQIASKPVVAITGSNAKSTVTTLLGEMAVNDGKNVKVGGNIGTPALDLLGDPDTDFYILELSSFQLDVTHSFHAHVATILNISPDHMDRYESLDEYIASKRMLYRECSYIIYNRDDPNTFPDNDFDDISFGLDEPDANQFGIKEKEGENYLAYGDELLLAVSELKLKGSHNWMNALAALALGKTIGLSLSTMLETLRTFKGLPHRCQLITENNNIAWYNDSKATNVGSTVAALEGIGRDVDGKVILIAGGKGKSADFSLLAGPTEKYASNVILFGQDADSIEKALNKNTAIVRANTLEDTVTHAKSLAMPGDVVLFSPACASFDMFDNFEQRGEMFIKLVEDIV